jgi:hypothetical protein
MNIPFMPALKFLPENKNAAYSKEQTALYGDGWHVE